MKKYSSILLILIICALNTQDSEAQFRFSNLFGGKDKPRKNRLFEPNSTVSLGVGTSSYYGDISPYNRFLQSTVNGMRWNVNFNFTRQFSPTFALRFGLTYARISGDDNYLEGVKGYEGNFIRNLHFRNDIKELSIVGQYDLVRTSRSYLRRANIIPYIFGGVAVFAHDPMAKPDASLYGNDWVRLQPLNTEGQGLPGYANNPYSLISVSFPLGVGVKYKLNKHWDLGIEMSYRYTLTDYLDDVSGNFADPADLAAQSPLAASMGNRSLEQIAARSGNDRTQGVINYLTDIGIYSASAPINPFSLTAIPGFSDKADLRGNPKYNDAYMLTTVKLIYHIPNKIKCPVTR
ncbi:DUF6089 family protein [Arcicella lustrica]|uniref:DUF6089 family protein n=1 Tax=Arcicella lustrica TaxID=2984196 RepID=A0ABU5SDU5_9BACT|nr:DUF6089 family protein [Arcicella sp. DC25W]MEA5425460.1 DUF6089 family protein [Arcicella sp. DC25W]